jgi:thiol-disulfide isomerase/thioredoxin
MNRLGRTGFVALLAVVALGYVLWRYRTTQPVDVGRPAPPVRAVDLQGRPVALAQLRGQVVLLNIWATWCAPCREEMPSLERLHRRLAPEGLRIVAVSVDEGARRVVADFARRFGLTFAIWHDPANRVGRAYRITGLPESFLIDRDGVIVKRVIGAKVWDDSATVALVRRVLHER